MFPPAYVRSGPLLKGNIGATATCKFPHRHNLSAAFIIRYRASCRGFNHREANRSCEEWAPRTVRSAQNLLQPLAAVAPRVPHALRCSLEQWTTVYKHYIALLLIVRPGGTKQRDCSMQRLALRGK